MKTLTVGNLEILAKGERGLADNDEFSRMEAELFLASLPTGGGEDWRFPTWNEWHYLLDLFSLGVLRSEIIPDKNDVFVWVKWEGLDRDIDPYRNFNKYWWPKRNSHNLAMYPFNRTLESDKCPWIDMTVLEETEKRFYILPIRNV